MEERQGQSSGLHRLPAGLLIPVTLQANQPTSVLATEAPSALTALCTLVKHACQFPAFEFRRCLVGALVCLGKRLLMGLVPGDHDSVTLVLPLTLSGSPVLPGTVWLSASASAAPA